MKPRLLDLFCGAGRINPDTGQTHLANFLDMGARVKSRTLLTEEGDPMPVYRVEHEPGFEPFSPQQVIITLAEEVLRLRGES